MLLVPVVVIELVLLILEGEHEYPEPLAVGGRGKVLGEEIHDVRHLLGWRSPPRIAVLGEEPGRRLEVVPGAEVEREELPRGGEGCVLAQAQRELVAVQVELGEDVLLVLQGLHLSAIVAAEERHASRILADHREAVKPQVHVRAGLDGPRNGRRRWRGSGAGAGFPSGGASGGACGQPGRRHQGE
jgi:hypothetical protein